MFPSNRISVGFEAYLLVQSSSKRNSYIVRRANSEDIWIYGYMDIWIYGCMDIWIYGYMGIWMMDISIYGYIFHISIYGYMDICSTYPYMAIWIYIPHIHV